MSYWWALSYWAKRSIHKFKTQIYALKAWIRTFKVWIFRLFTKGSKWQDRFLLWLCLQVAWLLFKNGLKWQFWDLLFCVKAQSNKGFKPLQTPPSRLCIAKSKFSMKRVPIKGGACKGLTALLQKLSKNLRNLNEFSPDDE